MAVLHYQPCDRLPLVHFGFWRPETLLAWAQQGHVTEEEAFSWRDGNVTDLTITDRLGFDFNWYTVFRPETRLHPYFAPEVVREFPDGTRHVINPWGVVVAEKTGITSIPAEYEYKLTDRASWEEDYKWRCQFSEDRVTQAEVRVGDKMVRFDQGGLEFLQSHQRDYPYGLECGSLYGQIRNMLGARALQKRHELPVAQEDEIIEAIAGKRIHGTATVPGGMNKALDADRRDALLAGVADVISWCKEAVALNEEIHRTHAENHDFAAIRSHFLSLAGNGGALELYHGGLRARAATGELIFDDADYRGYAELLSEEVRPWSYMKFPFLQSLGREEGWYRVGPLSRVNNCDVIPTPLAEKARQQFRDYADGELVHDTLAYHWARMIEALHCAESIELLLRDPEITGAELVVPEGKRRHEGIGVIEAPRGTLFHHYRVNDDGLIEKANLIVSTTSNNQAMNASVRAVADRYLDGRTLTEGLLNHLEVAVRAYDPCLSCATHALGRMPLQVELLDPDGHIVDRLTKGGADVPEILVFGYGNPGRGDDGIGPAFMERLVREGLDAAGDVECQTDMQLQVEHVTDLCVRRLVLADQVDPGVDRGGRARALEQHVGADAVGEAHDPLGRILFGQVDRVVAPQRARDL